MTAWEGGKGSAPRPLSVDGDTFASNWDRIFGQDCKGQADGLQGMRTPQEGAGRAQGQGQGARQEGRGRSHWGRTGGQ